MFQYRNELFGGLRFQKKALEQANGAKLEGNKLFGDGQFEEALSQYELALQVAPDMPSSSELRSICHANRAICYSKLMSSRINIHHPHQVIKIAD
nr:sperm-associated antigen 1-like [Quercus suber]